jgi:hypothetical protein
VNRRLVVIAGALGVTGASGCSAFRLDSVPARVQEAFRNGGDPNCTADSSRAERVATALDVDGAKLELWLAPTDDGGEVTAMILTEPEGEPFGMATSCGFGRPGGGVDGGNVVVEMGGGAVGSGPGGRERWWSSGRAPADAETVEADFGDVTVVADVGADGYFIVVHSEPGGDGTTSGASPRLTALDEDGNELPRG